MVSVCERPVPPSDVATGPFRIGQRVGGTYEITSVLGIGGMNAVYEAYDASLRRRVAIKAPLFAAYAAALKREAQALAAIRSPSFVSIFQLGAHDGVDFVVMERIFGETLEQRLDEMRVHGGAQRLSIGEALSLLGKLADALSAAHRVGIAHRDLKPSNVLIAGERVVLFDLGLFVPEVLVSPDDDVAGSVLYIAPEVILRDVEKGGGPRIDLYALGVIAFELLTGTSPFTGESNERVLANHVCAAAPDVRTMRADVPVELAALIAELLAKDPKDRPPSAECVLWQLRDLESRTMHPDRALKVVALDDEPHVGFALKRSLESAFPKLRVEATTDPTRATRAHDGSMADIVLVDLRMPGENGVEVCMNLLALPPRRRPVVIAMSSDAAPNDVAVLEALGVRHFVKKDDAFLTNVSAVIGRLRADGAVAPSSTREP